MKAALPAQARVLLPQSCRVIYREKRHLLSVEEPSLVLSHMWITNYTWGMSCIESTDTGSRWRRCILGSLKLQVNFRKRAATSKALLRNLRMTYTDKAFYASSAPCKTREPLAWSGAIPHVRENVSCWAGFKFFERLSPIIKLWHTWQRVMVMIRWVIDTDGLSRSAMNEVWHT